ncbi:PF07600 domain protein [Leptospira kirschneri serovar Sokoine str. RM1]|nr:PF07600 domain protein [Leptospira kirschneri serovar Sokoine str. RM1]
MDILLLDDCQKIESALVENSVGTDSLLVPDDYWNRLNSQERKALRSKLPILLRKYSKRIASMERLHHKAGKIKYNRGVGKMKKFSIRVNTGVWRTWVCWRPLMGFRDVIFSITCFGWRTWVERKIFL